MGSAIRVASVGRMGSPPRLPALSAAMLAELEAVLDDDLFRQAPDLVRLLQHLVDMTLAGDDERVTPYSIAVEVGEIGGFDTRYGGTAHRAIDRLCAALDSHYQQRDAVGGLCLTIVAGSYRVWIVRPEAAYPAIFRRPKMVEWPFVPKAQRISPRFGIRG